MRVPFTAAEPSPGRQHARKQGLPVHARPDLGAERRSAAYARMRRRPASKRCARHVQSIFEAVDHPRCWACCVRPNSATAGTKLLLHAAKHAGKCATSSVKVLLCHGVRGDVALYKILHGKDGECESALWSASLLVQQGVRPSFVYNFRMQRRAQRQCMEGWLRRGLTR